MKLTQIISLLAFATILTQSCSGQGNSTKNDTVEYFTILTYGPPQDLIKVNSENVIAKKWKIKYSGIAGCKITMELRDSVERNNNIVYENLEKKYGKNWEKKMDKEIEVEFKREKQVAAILDTIDFIKKKNDELYLEGNLLHYRMRPIGNSYEYSVDIHGWGHIDGKDEGVRVIYYKMKVNYKTKKCELISDKIELEE